MVIRRESPEEFPQIYALVKEAFKTAKVSNGREQDFVDTLRCSGGYIPELALVAQEQGRLVGHIMLTKTCYKSGDMPHGALLLAPLSVAPAFQNQGVGSALVREALERAAALGHTSVFLVGDPAYYHRFGFRASILFNIKNKDQIPDENVMVCELVPGALSPAGGSIAFETC